MPLEERKEFRVFFVTKATEALLPKSNIYLMQKCLTAPCTYRNNSLETQKIPLEIDGMRGKIKVESHEGNKTLTTEIFFEAMSVERKIQA